MPNPCLTPFRDPLSVNDDPLSGKRGNEAVKHLLGGRTFDQLEKDIALAWRGSGLDIEFQ